MSASPWARQATESKAIPIRRVTINDSSELPSSYSSTPGGTLYSTTPGGTRIVYEKSMLMNLRNSPISKTPPSYDIPDSVIKGKGFIPPKNNSYNSYAKRIPTTPNKRSAKNEDDVQFQIDL